MSDHDSLTAALAAVQANLPKIAKGKTAVVPTKTGGQYKYKYADLSDVSEAILPLLAEHGLAWTCLPEFVDGRFQLRGVLRHVSDQQIEAAWPLPFDENPQKLGGHLTYARRYLLCAVTGVAADEDDDAQLAAGRHDDSRQRLARNTRTKREAPPEEPPPSPPPEPEPETGELADPRLVQRLNMALVDYGLRDRADKLTYLSGMVGREIESSKDLTRAEALDIDKTVRMQLAEDRRQAAQERKQAANE